MFRPIVVGGGLRSIRGSFAVLWNKASAAIIIPGAMAPPRYTPFLQWHQM